MAKYKRRYYFLVMFLLLIMVAIIITLSVAKPPVEFGLAEENEVLEESKNEQAQETPGQEIKRFSTFQSCYSYAFSQLLNAKSYKSAVSGYVKGSPIVGAIDINYSISNLVGAYKEVDNEQKISYVKGYTKATGAIGATMGMEYYQENGQVYNRSGSWTGSDFEFSGDFTQSEYNDFIDYWKVDPVDLFIAVDYRTVKTGQMIKNGSDYVLKFTMPALASLDNLIQFCVKQFNQPGTENLKPQADYLNFEVAVNAYGMIKKIECRSNFKCNLGPIGMSAITLDGEIYSSETFSSINSNVEVKNPTKWEIDEV